MGHLSNLRVCLLHSSVPHWEHDGMMMVMTMIETCLYRMGCYIVMWERESLEMGLMTSILNGLYLFQKTGIRFLYRPDHSD